MGTVTPSLKKLGEILAPMSWKDRLEYLWTYYKFVLAILAAAILVISLIVNAVQGSKIDTLYGGALLGTSVSEEKCEAFSQELLELFDGDGVNQVIDFSMIPYYSINGEINVELQQTAIMKLTVMVAAQSLDFILTDADSFELFISQSDYADIRTLLTPEQQAQLEPYYVYSKESEETKPYPIAVDISHTAFARNFLSKDGTLYLTFPGNGENPQRNEAFVNYLLTAQ